MYARAIWGVMRKKAAEKTQFPANLDSFPDMMKWIRTHLTSPHLSKVDSRKVELAAEEALVNIIRYAYPDQNGKVDLEIDFQHIPYIQLAIIDQGVPFNPVEKFQQEGGKPHCKLEEQPIGGLGIRFMMQLMDEVNYKREQNTNLLIMRKKSFSSE
ncbi:MAG: Serine-protein kinase RsbW [Chlamydiia bacterium]|nr:Serine-protein kinase RsbW [Chlamydiia bacterium]